jgi:hypothetical protein
VAFAPTCSRGHKGEADQVVLNAERFSLYFPATRGSKAPAAHQSSNDLEEKMLAAVSGEYNTLP